MSVLAAPRPSVVLVETGMGNVRSVARALERVGADVALSGDPERIARADRIVVPGQGHFGDGARALDRGLGEALRAFAATGRPYLGICLGMQLLFESSEEAPGARGLGLFEGTVRRFADGMRLEDGTLRKVPHMGWSRVRARHPLLAPEEWFYFVHSYHCVPADPSLRVAEADYGEPVCAAVARDNVFACQFHPEKSQRAGSLLLARFVGTERG